ncbi:hypothetical protein J4401_01570 [Candidatus Woesearchaeota archaeon]|nr:hypothetical protein [Candidatus Woesearchaeota archaeon]
MKKILLLLAFVSVILVACSSNAGEKTVGAAYGAIMSGSVDESISAKGSGQQRIVTVNQPPTLAIRQDSSAFDTSENGNFIIAAYRCYLFKDPTGMQDVKGEFAYWLGRLGSKFAPSRQEFIYHLYLSSGFQEQGIYTKFTGTKKKFMELDDGDFVESVYSILRGRPPTKEEYNAAFDALLSGVPREDIARYIIYNDGEEVKSYFMSTCFFKIKENDKTAWEDFFKSSTMWVNPLSVKSWKGFYRLYLPMDYIEKEVGRKWMVQYGGETKTYTFRGANYIIWPEQVDAEDGTVRIIVNGEVSPTLMKGSHYLFNSGLSIMVTNIAMEIPGYKSPNKESFVEFSYYTTRAR